MIEFGLYHSKVFNGQSWKHTSITQQLSHSEKVTYFPKAYLIHLSLQNGDNTLPYQSLKAIMRIKWDNSCVSSVQSLSCVWLLATSWITARQASLSITNSKSSPKLMSIELVMPSSYLILCRPLLLLPAIPPSVRVFSNGSALCMRWPSTGLSALSSVLPKNTRNNLL